MSKVLHLGAAALLAGLLASGASAQTRLSCPDLKKIVAAAVERPSFASLVKPQGSDLAARFLPKGFTSCSAARFTTAGIDDRYSCSLKPGMTQQEAQAALDALQSDAAACLGVSGSKAGMMDSRGHGHLDYQVQQGGRPVKVSVLGSYWSIKGRDVVLGVSVGRP